MSKALLLIEDTLGGKYFYDMESRKILPEAIPEEMDTLYETFLETGEQGEELQKVCKLLGITHIRYQTDSGKMKNTPLHKFIQRLQKMYRNAKHFSGFIRAKAPGQTWNTYKASEPTEDRESLLNDWIPNMVKQLEEAGYTDIKASITGPF